MPFYLGQHEVTVGQFRKFVESSRYKTEAESDGKGGYGFNISDGTSKQDVQYNWRNLGFTQGDDHPVVNVSWNDANRFCQWLSREKGRTHRLPSEAEWEFACRAGTTTQFSMGDNAEGLASVGKVADGTAKAKYNWKYAIQAKDGFVTTAPIGSFAENPWGLYDMHGNVWEWCQDSYGDYETAAVTDPVGAIEKEGSNRVNRGGSWNNNARNCRSENRNRNSPDNRNNNLGFRVSLAPSVMRLLVSWNRSLS